MMTLFFARKLTNIGVVLKLFTRVGIRQWSLSAVGGTMATGTACARR